MKQRIGRSGTPEEYAARVGRVIDALGFYHRAKAHGVHCTGCGRSAAVCRAEGDA